MEKDRPNPFHDDQWYPLKLGRTCHEDASTRFYSLRYEFKPASIDNSRRGSLHSSAEGKATVEFFNNQAGKPKLTFEGNMGDYQALDGMLFFDGDSFRVERMHRSVRNLRHIRVPGESSAAAATVTTKETEHESPTDGNGNNVEKITSQQSGDNKSTKKPAGPVARSEKIEADVGAPAAKPDLPSGAAKKKGNKKGPSESKAAAAKKASPVVASVAAPPSPIRSPPNRKREREPSPVNIDTEEVAEESPSKKVNVVEEEQIEDEEVVEVSEEVESDYDLVDISEDEDVDKTGLDPTAASLRAQAAAGLLETKASSSSSSSASGSSESGSGSSSSDSGTDEEGSASSADDGEDI